MVSAWGEWPSDLHDGYGTLGAHASLALSQLGSAARPALPCSPYHGTSERCRAMSCRVLSSSARRAAIPLSRETAALNAVGRPAPCALEAITTAPTGDAARRPQALLGAPLAALVVYVVLERGLLLAVFADAHSQLSPIHRAFSLGFRFQSTGTPAPTLSSRRKPGWGKPGWPLPFGASAREGLRSAGSRAYGTFIAPRRLRWHVASPLVPLAAWAYFLNPRLATDLPHWSTRCCGRRGQSAARTAKRPARRRCSRHIATRVPDCRVRRMSVWDVLPECPMVECAAGVCGTSCPSARPEVLPPAHRAPPPRLRTPAAALVSVLVSAAANGSLHALGRRRAREYESEFLPIRWLEWGRGWVLWSRYPSM